MTLHFAESYGNSTEESVNLLIEYRNHDSRVSTMSLSNLLRTCKEVKNGRGSLTGTVIKKIIKNNVGFLHRLVHFQQLPLKRKQNFLRNIIYNLLKNVYLALRSNQFNFIWGIDFFCLPNVVILHWSIFFCHGGINTFLSALLQPCTT